MIQESLFRATGPGASGIGGMAHFNPRVPIAVKTYAQRLNNLEL
jgi:hypothetical protein